MAARTPTANRDLKNIAYSTLKDRLINCIYPPGSILNEAQLATELSLSRTPIREALSRLEMDGFVRIMPKKGIYVTDISLPDIFQIFQTRLEIEPVTTRMAALLLPESELLSFRNKFEQETPDIANAFRLDTAMHLFIIEHCGNRYIIDMMHKIFDENTRIIISSKQNQLQIHDARREHIEILDCLLARDVEKSAVLMRSHIENCRQAALNYFCNFQTACFTSSPDTYKKELQLLERASAAVT
ncbi:MAG: GntR family transcriptional regulator [Eubacteriales bacterium]|nr:GntR family transcriptional regulator [Eubacteriales bacterium]